MITTPDALGYYARETQGDDAIGRHYMIQNIY
jgi:hypothetical protein